MLDKNSLVSDYSLDQFLELNQLTNLESCLLIDSREWVCDSKHEDAEYKCIADHIHPCEWMECIECQDETGCCKHGQVQQECDKHEECCVYLDSDLESTASCEHKFADLKPCHD